MLDLYLQQTQNTNHQRRTEFGFMGLGFVVLQDKTPVQSYSRLTVTTALNLLVAEFTSPKKCTLPIPKGIISSLKM